MGNTNFNKNKINKRRLTEALHKNINLNNRMRIYGYSKVTFTNAREVDSITFQWKFIVLKKTKPFTSLSKLYFSNQCYVTRKRLIWWKNNNQIKCST